MGGVDVEDQRGRNVKADSRESKTISCVCGKTSASTGTVNKRKAARVG